VVEKEVEILREEKLEEKKRVLVFTPGME